MLLAEKGTDYAACVCGHDLMLTKRMHELYSNLWLVCYKRHLKNDVMAHHNSVTALAWAEEKSEKKNKQKTILTTNNNFDASLRNKIKNLYLIICSIKQ